MTKQHIEVPVNVQRWILEMGALALSRCNHCSLIEVEQVVDEMVWVLGFDAVGRESAAGRR